MSLPLSKCHIVGNQVSRLILFCLNQGEACKGEPEVVYNSESFAAQLLKHGSNPDATEPESGTECRVQAQV